MKRFPLLLSALALVSAFGAFDAAAASDPADAFTGPAPSYHGNRVYAPGGRRWERGYRGDYEWTQPGPYRCAERGTCRQWRPDYKRFRCSARSGLGGFYEATGSSMYSAQVKALKMCKASEPETSCSASACWQLGRNDR
jgi:hypothetical protein